MERDPFTLKLFNHVWMDPMHLKPPELEQMEFIHQSCMDLKLPEFSKEPPKDREMYMAHLQRQGIVSAGTGMGSVCERFARVHCSSSQMSLKEHRP
jgi:hypothetical protein